MVKESTAFNCTETSKVMEKLKRVFLLTTNYLGIDRMEGPDDSILLIDRDTREVFKISFKQEGTQGVVMYDRMPNSQSARDLFSIAIIKSRESIDMNESILFQSVDNEWLISKLENRGFTKVVTTIPELTHDMLYTRKR